METQVEVAAQAPYILSLQMDEGSQERFDRLREEHYPAELNRIAAHLTLFHKLTRDEAVRSAVAMEAAAVARFSMRVTGVRSLGRGVAYAFESAELQGVHRRLAGVFAEQLTAQDRQTFRPHVVVQNKASGEKARELKERLSGGFQSFQVGAVGLELWLYLGGPWELAERFPLQ